MKKPVTKIFVVLFAVLMVFLTACGTKEAKFLTKEEMQSINAPLTGVIVLEYDNAYCGAAKNELYNYRVTLTFELYYDKAPNTVANFVTMVRNEFYNTPDAGETEKTGYIVDTYNESKFLMGAKYYEMVTEEDTDTEDDIIPEPEDTLLTVKPEYYIAGEFEENEWKLDDKSVNDIEFAPDVLYMNQLITGNFDSAYSQFGIMGNADSYASYDGNYAAFGKITRCTIERKLPKQTAYTQVGAYTASVVSRMLNQGGMQNLLTSEGRNDAIYITKISMESTDAVGNVKKIAVED